jgi:hypothetical protein
MPKRVVIPELLDHLAANDPDAIRSRRDLQRINFLMGNERWILNTLRRFPQVTLGGIVELGAGDGRLCNVLAEKFPQATITAYDLAPAPADLAPRVKWQRGDLLRTRPPAAGGVRIANLFLHHFEGESLEQLGRWMEDADLLIFNEPDRSQLPHRIGGLMHPWINHVTRHDMHVSIDAGFSADEIHVLLGLDPNLWTLKESSTLRGARRVIGRKKDWQS